MAAMPPLLLDLLYLPAALLYLPVLLYRLIALGKGRRGWAERLGFVAPRADRRPCVWIHAVSLGEVNAVRRLVAEIERRLPDHQVAVSATTDTGYAAARRLYAPRPVFRCPLDFSGAVRRALRRVRPAAIVLVELEVWPNLVALATRAGVPVGVANGRVTADRSVRRFRLPLVRGIARRMFGQLAWVAAQNETYAARFRELGVPAGRVRVLGNLKYDNAAVADAVPGDAALAAALGIDRRRPLIVAGSTGPGEEELLLDAVERLRREDPTVQLAIVPRKPERFEEVARLIAGRGLTCVRRSRRPDAAPPIGRGEPPGAGGAALRGGVAAPREKVEALREGVEPRREKVEPPREKVEALREGVEPLREGVEPLRETVEPPRAKVEALRAKIKPPAEQPVFLGDTMGELRKFYALADVIFVGRSLVPLGGSDLMEAAGLGRAVCFGPHVENFADVAAELAAADAAVRLNGPADLLPALRRLLRDRAAAAALGRRAQEVVRRNTGASRRTADLLAAVLGRAGPAPLPPGPDTA